MVAPMILINFSTLSTHVVLLPDPILGGRLAARFLPGQGLNGLDKIIASGHAPVVSRARPQLVGPVQFETQRPPHTEGRRIAKSCMMRIICSRSSPRTLNGFQ
jgi:hypothetical protein